MDRLVGFNFCCSFQVPYENDYALMFEQRCTISYRPFCTASCQRFAVCCPYVFGTKFFIFFSFFCSIHIVIYIAGLPQLRRLLSVLSVL